MKTTTNKAKATAGELAPGATIYSKPLLSIYDLYVLGFSSNFVWQCPSRLILDFYNEHISGNHLDMGIGTGYFIDKCKFPIPHPTSALGDSCLCLPFD